MVNAFYNLLLSEFFFSYSYSYTPLHAIRTTQEEHIKPKYALAAESRDR